jgi:1-acyl-sn-glycerol-3-phosphate acyltransferase
MSTDFHSPKFLRYGFPLLRVGCWLFLTLLGPFRTRGRYRVPKTGGLLILANHLSDVDPIAVQAACSRPIYFMAKSELFEMKVLGSILRCFKAFPVKRGEPDRDALKRAANLLKSGACVCIFPEGQLSESGDLQTLKPGVALIVRMSNAPVICLGLKHTNRIMPYGKFVPRPALRWVEACWGEVRHFSKNAETEEIMGWTDGQLRAFVE